MEDFIYTEEYRYYGNNSGWYPVYVRKSSISQIKPDPFDSERTILYTVNGELLIVKIPFDKFIELIKGS